MNRTLYSLVKYLLSPFIIIYLLFKGIREPLYRHRIYERLAVIPKIPVPVIWVHCSSIGEFKAANSLINALIKDFTKHRVLVTTVTATGSELVQDTYQKNVLHYYLSLDLPFIVDKYIEKINPSVCIFLEKELWPNLIHSLNKKKIPTLLVNARLSQQSLKRYQKFMPGLAKQTLNKINIISTQDESSANRFIELGAYPGKVVVAGNIKFDQNLILNKAISKELKVIIGNRKVLVFASTHRGEERSIVSSFLKYKDCIDALLVIVPRHPDRFDEVYNLLQKNKLNTVKRSNNRLCKDCDALLGDSMGEMMNYCDVADIVFMGGSLNKTGGHNMLEPASLSKPILFGPNVFNFAEISSDLLKHNGAIQISSADDLFKSVANLLADPKSAKSLGNNANEYFKSKQGAVKKLTKQVRSVLL